ncbi:MAG: prepilin-type N-terminal cleavage/methylation domain-containing protein [Planctomycetes bacterium]|nr:prepilin-type N-terminal cleavage/methylation domain-containing protein [Planctomycetota bacterium]
MARRASARRAMTLLELSVVTAIIGLLAVMAATRYGSSTMADVGAQGFARRLALDFTQARQRAIATGDNHLVRFTIAGGKATQYALYRRQGVSTTLVDEVNVVPADVNVTTAGTTDAEFTFTGEALASYTITIQAPDRTWTVTVPQVTGKAFVQ